MIGMTRRREKVARKGGRGEIWKRRKGRRRKHGRRDNTALFAVAKIAVEISNIITVEIGIVMA